MTSLPFPVALHNEASADPCLLAYAKSDTAISFWFFTFAYLCLSEADGVKWREESSGSGAAGGSPGRVGSGRVESSEQERLQLMGFHALKVISNAATETSRLIILASYSVPRFNRAETHLSRPISYL